MPLVIGARLGPYEVLSPLGAGGMGEVYRARDTRLNRDVALKVLPELFITDAERVGRFQREAQLLASLNHPNIAAIYGLEESDGVRAIVLELVDGPTLADRIAQGPIAVEESLRLARQIAEALEAAHEKGIVHRDLKPANIKLTPAGDVKVLDFGLARLIESETESSAGPAGRRSLAVTNSPTITSPAMTMAGVILGTAAYMSPEQAKGGSADKRSDVWAFGCVLYEMLTGKRAFEGEDVSDTLAAILRGEPDWSAIPAGVPPSVRTLIQRCLERDRRERIGDIAAALFVLRDPTVGTPTLMADTTAPRRPLWRRAALLAIGAAVMIAIGVLAGRALKPAVPLQVARFAITLPEGQRLTEFGLSMIAVAPDGSRIVYVANRRLFVRSLSDPEARAIPGGEPLSETDRPSNPVFSPDGRSIAYLSLLNAVGGAALKTIPVAGGTPVTVSQIPSVSPGMSWDSRGIILAQPGRGILRVRPDSGEQELVVGITDALVAYPQMLPGEDAVLYAFVPGVTDPATAPPGFWDTAKIAVQSLTSKQRTLVVDGGTAPTYAATGHLLYVKGGSLFAVRFDPRRREKSGLAVAVIDGVARARFAGVATAAAYIAVSQNGSAIYVPGSASSPGQLDLAYVNRGGTIEPLNLPPKSYVFPRVSPDGKQIAVATDDGKDAQVWIYDTSGANAIRPLTFGGRNMYPVWSGDGRYVAFQSDREGDLGIYSQRADGSDAAERLTTADPGTAQIPESWSPDSRTLLYSESKDRDFTVWALSLPEKNKVRFSKARSSVDPPSAMFSTDGRWVAYLSTDASRRTVFIEPFPATGVIHAIGSDMWHPVWTRDGLFCRAAGGRLQFVRVTLTPFASGKPETLPTPVEFQSRGRAEREHDIMPDGRFLTVTAAGRGTKALGDGGTSVATDVQQIDVVLNWFEELKQRVAVK